MHKKIDQEGGGKHLGYHESSKTGGGGGGSHTTSARGGVSGGFRTKIVTGTSRGWPDLRFGKVVSKREVAGIFLR